MITYATITADPFTQEILADVAGVENAHAFQICKGRYLIWCVASPKTISAWQLNERCDEALRQVEEWERRLTDVDLA